ncbi:adenylate kinase family protein, partial [Aetokthonos hydrillicola]
MRLVILGGSGSGKSTQAQKLCAYFDIPIISIDEILWGVFANYTDLSRQPQSLLETKTFVSHEIMTEFIRTRLTQVDVEHGWVLEGYPRSVFQA